MSAVFIATKNAGSLKSSIYRARCEESPSTVNRYFLKISEPRLTAEMENLFEEVLEPISMIYVRNYYIVYGSKRQPNDFPAEYADPWYVTDDDW
jgi:hypothetical protein